MIADAIRAYLLADGGVSAITSTIIPIVAVKGTSYPCVIYHVVTSDDDYDTDGATSYRIAKFQFDCYSAVSYKQARALEYAVRHAINNFKGLVSDPDALSPPVPINILGCFVGLSPDMPPPEGELNVEWRVMFQVDVHYQEN